MPRPLRPGRALRAAGWKAAFIAGVVFALLTAPLPAPGQDPQQPAARAEEVPPSGVTLPPAPLAADSIYRLGSVWTDQKGQVVPLASLRGRPLLVAMIYTHCTEICSWVVEDMKRIEALLTDDAHARVRFALFSFDSERDTPEVLEAFRRKHGLDPARWTLFTGDPAGVRALAAALGVHYRRESTGDFSHTRLISVLDREGVIRHQQPEPVEQEHDSVIVWPGAPR